MKGYYSAGKEDEILSLVANWMELEDVRLSEVNRKMQEDKHHMFLSYVETKNIFLQEQ